MLRAYSLLLNLYPRHKLTFSLFAIHKLAKRIWLRLRGGEMVLEETAFILILLLLVWMRQRTCCWCKGGTGRAVFCICSLPAFWKESWWLASISKALKGLPSLHAVPYSLHSFIAEFADPSHFPDMKWEKIQVYPKVFFSYSILTL